MPQMAPMNWVSLYFMFILIFVMFIIVIYFTFMYIPNPPKQLKQKKKMFWKW
uniref:ATP synthase complex subunit 8 n=1 Tax=Leptomias sp. DX-2020 TaxID=2748276 RepID=A0A7D9MYX0_9CUCU|nr:ATP synthase F0 subunit 8 [Leptomias sp. DX-2020]